MKKLFVLLILLIGTLSFSQTKPKTKDIDKDVKVFLDSLSKVYKYIMPNTISTQNIPKPI
jgi:hypothetical protein